VRRFVPWLLIALVALGGAAGAALGIAAHRTPSESPSQWVAAVLATTEAAGSARFSFTQITSSPNPDLRGSVAGGGAVNFARGEAHVAEVGHQISFTSTNNQPLHPVHQTNTQRAIVIGSTVYQANPIPGFAFTDKYHRLPFPKLPRAQQGLSLALNAAVALDGLHGPNPVASVRALGPAAVGGTVTTQYEVSYAPLRVCPPHQAPVVVRQLPTDVWVDDAGRLVQARSTSFFSGQLPKNATLPSALQDVPRGPTTTVATLRFSAFGSPVHVVAPPASAIAGSGSSFSVMLEQGKSCRS
jgi:hypothetical protein